jgi:serine protease AprX
MADSTGEHQGERLPIKVILPKQGKERPVPGGGAPPKPFRPVTPEYRASLGTQVSAIQRVMTPTVSARVGSIPLRVRVISQAVAKSHRPERLFSEATCPIVGAGGLGELFVKGTPGGLASLRHMIESDNADRVVKELSSIEVIEPITSSARRAGAEAIEILRKSPRRRKGFLTRVKLFDYGPDPDQERLLEDFMRSCSVIEAPVRQAGYSPKSFTYEVECQSADQVESISRIIGVRSIGPMPVLRTVRPRVLNVVPLAGSLPSAADVLGDYPIVAVVDTGIIDANDTLNSWVIGRESFVPPANRNPTHGTFVAGLICWASQLNPNLKDISDGPCGVLDVQIIPNADPGYGDTDEVSESEFLESLEAALQKHANRVKVWNLSLSTDEVCSLDSFSLFAQQLDDLQERYQVSFVVSAGNYNTLPLLDYPRDKAQSVAGRITSPADSVLGVTVGAISHLDYKSKGPKLDHPSAFSRHGAGPNHIIKPDLVHYGGTCATDASHTAGITSIHVDGCGEDMGTSFSTPLVSRSLAETYHHITPTPSPVLARALLTHHARDPRGGGRVPDGEENFFGFGRPVPPPYCLECTPHSSTLIFEDTLRPSYFLEWDDFPYPKSLSRDGRYFGQVWMTVAFAPARGPRWGTEYCETHIEANFGVFYERTNRKTGEVTEEFKGLVPPEHKNPGQLYESYQVRELRKWAPVRTYFGDLNPGGERGLRWRLKLQLLSRHGVEKSQATIRPQPFSLIITIADPEGQAPVYDEMAQVIRNRFQADNLVVRSGVRITARN